MEQRTLINNQFLIEPYEGQYLLYAPLRGVVLHVNKDAVSVIDYLQQNPNIDINTNASISTFVGQLKTKGIHLQELFDEKLPPNPVFSFKPVSATLLPTFDCNLRCVYCYAESGEISKTQMSWEIAKASIDLIINNSLEIGSRKVKVSFHGGGEPTLNWHLLTKTIGYAQELTYNNKLQLHTDLTTNGVLSEAQCKWVSENLSRIQISFDGTCDIQNMQRPMANGNGSFQNVLKTINYFEKKQVSYGIQTVITSKSVNKMTDLVRFFSKITTKRELHFEPVFECGRCLNSGWEEPTPETFAEEFVRAWKYAAYLSINLICSLSRLNTRVSSFCGATNKNFFITPEGDVTACLEVSRWSDSRAKTFIYGRYDPEKNIFIIDQEKLNYLSTRNIYNMPTCSDCAVKWHCAGDCLAKALSNGDMFNPVKTDRCNMTKLISSRQLFELLNNPKIGQVVNYKILNIEN